ncbi:DUF4382 domain-containing protein [Luteirhabdus pelagi]|uniref:DUF4382 domain-containing protein n=1 Tax=Luteirhabdus pelagi TaxID=2792783 RepID=UPI0019395271|nr:DUF4382 domain-containing protein [Luteirhabdus pelagi]
MIKNVTNLALIMLLAVVVYSCSDDDSNPNDNPNNGTAQLSVQMVDAPGDYEAVYVDVEDVVVKYGDDENEISVGNVNAGIYNLLELTGGVTAELFDGEVEAGNIKQIRLILGGDNTIVVDGETYPLATPSAQQSGLKVNVDMDLEYEEVYDVVLDFDVDASIVEQGNGGYTLKPVIRAEQVIGTGSITGIILPAGVVQTSVTATNGTFEATSYTNTDGTFTLMALPVGTYDVTINIAEEVNLPPITIPDVEVNANAETTLETIELEL